MHVPKMEDAGCSPPPKKKGIWLSGVCRFQETCF